MHLHTFAISLSESQVVGGNMTPEQRQQDITRLSERRDRLHQRIGAHLIAKSRLHTIIILPMNKERDEWQKLLAALEKVEQEQSALSVN
jgi:hypothetical protein